VTILGTPIENLRRGKKKFVRKKNFSEKGEEIRAFDDITNLLRNLGL
jgi:hypothetical protein